MSELIDITEAPLEPESLVEAVSGPDKGGIATFIGTVRESSQDREVSYLVYECYREMALKEMRTICAEAEKRWPVRVAAHHRVGRLEIGEASVAIAAASAHRADAFAACRFIIDEIKNKVPIWKKEVFTDGEEWMGLQSETAAEGAHD